MWYYEHSETILDNINEPTPATQVFRWTPGGTQKGKRGAEILQGNGVRSKVNLGVYLGLEYFKDNHSSPHIHPKVSKILACGNF